MDHTNNYYYFEALPMFQRTLRGSFSPQIDIALNETEIKTLLLVSNHQGRTMSFYSRITGVEKGSFTATTDKLEQKGLLHRMELPSDRRKKGLMLTQAGERTALLLKEQFRDHLQQRLGQLPRDVQEELLSALEVIEKLRKMLE